MEKDTFYRTFYSKIGLAFYLLFSRPRSAFFIETQWSPCLKFRPSAFLMKNFKFDMSFSKEYSAILGNLRKFLSFKQREIGITSKNISNIGPKFWNITGTGIWFVFYTSFTVLQNHFICQYAQRIGIEARQALVHDDQAVVILRWQGIDPDAPSILLYSHTDCSPNFKNSVLRESSANV